MHYPEPKNIIIRMPNWLGDAVMATPIIRDVRHRWPKAKITAMCLQSVAQLLAHDPNIDEIFSFHRPNGWLHREQYRNILTPMRHGEYDLGILLTNSFSSCWWFWRGRVKNRVGFACNLRSLFLNTKVPFPEEKERQHLVQTYKSLLVPLGIPISDTDPRLYLNDEEKRQARDLLARFGAIEGKKIVGINPGAAYGSAKCWPPERFRKVTESLLEDPDVYVVYFGDHSGAPLVSSICRGMPDRVINLAAKTNLRELLALIDACAVLLTNDSGPMHIGAALSTPLLALFGSTSEIKTGPYKSGTVIHKHVSCSPCYKRTCPIDFRCMKEISVNEVAQNLKHIIAGSSKHTHA